MICARMIAHTSAIYLFSFCIQSVELKFRNFKINSGLFMQLPMETRHHIYNFSSKANVVPHLSYCWKFIYKTIIYDLHESYDSYSTRKICCTIVLKKQTSKKILVGSTDFLKTFSLCNNLMIPKCCSSFFGVHFV